MWFWLAVLALVMLVTRRSSEKAVSKNINSMAMAWVQQTIAMPFIILTLFFAKFYWPSELPVQFWTTMMVYVCCLSISLYCYFKALSIADISYIAPLFSLFAVGNIIGAYFVLGQTPSVYGFAGAWLIVCGAFVTHKGKQKNLDNHKPNKQALFLILTMVVLMGYMSNIEVNMLRVSNPTSFNFYSSILTVPFILLVSSLVVKRRKGRYDNYWPDLKTGVNKHLWALTIIGISYTVNMLATYQAKLISPNAGYVGAVKSAQVLPLVLIGLFFFNEKIVRQQWYGLGLIVVGLGLLFLN